MSSNASATQYADSYYGATRNKTLNFPSLSEQLDVDVCVVGGGYTGLSTALHLAEKGFQVALLECHQVGWGASGRNGGHVGTGQRKEQEELENMLGLARAKQLWQFGLEAVALVEELIKKHHISCDLKRGILHVAAKASHRAGMEDSAAHLAEVYDYHQARYCPPDEVNAMVGASCFHGGFLDEGSLHLHPLNFALGLAEAAQRGGVQIFENSRVTKIAEGHRPRVHTDHGLITCRYVVLGCNGYLENLYPKVAGKIMPINNFVIATEPLSEDLCRELIRDDVAVQDSLFVINYWKLSADRRLIFGGGENYSSQFPADIKNFVRKYLLKIYPQLERTNIDYGWGGTLAITLNRMPHFHRDNNIYTAHGYSGHGVPTATFAGKVVAEAIAGDAQKFDVFSGIPTPTFPGGVWLRKPGLVLGMMYYALLDRL